jgi:hypothetical protein
MIIYIPAYRNSTTGDVDIPTANSIYRRLRSGSSFYKDLDVAKKNAPGAEYFHVFNIGYIGNTKDADSL